MIIFRGKNIREENDGQNLVTYKNTNKDKKSIDNSSPLQQTYTQNDVLKT